MRAGLLTEKIHILRPITVCSETGYQETVYDSCIRCRAYVRRNSGSRTVQNDEVVFPESITLQIRRFYSFDETYRIRWEDTDYRILSIDRKREQQCIEIIAEKIEL